MKTKILFFIFIFVASLAGFANDKVKDNGDHYTLTSDDGKVTLKWSDPEWYTNTARTPYYTKYIISTGTKKTIEKSLPSDLDFEPLCILNFKTSVNTIYIITGAVWGCEGESTMYIRAFNIKDNKLVPIPFFKTTKKTIDKIEYPFVPLNRNTYDSYYGHRSDIWEPKYDASSKNLYIPVVELRDDYPEYTDKSLIYHFNGNVFEYIGIKADKQIPFLNKKCTYNTLSSSDGKLTFKWRNNPDTLIEQYPDYYSESYFFNGSKKVSLKHFDSTFVPLDIIKLKSNDKTVYLTIGIDWGNIYGHSGIYINAFGIANNKIAPIPFFKTKTELLKEIYFSIPSPTKENKDSYKGYHSDIWEPKYDSATKNLYIPLINEDDEFADKCLIYHFNGNVFEYTGIKANRQIPFLNK